MKILGARARDVSVSLWPLALACLVATLWGLVHVWIRLQLVAVGYEISRQTQRSHELTELTQRLSLELRTRLDLGTLERVAREKLHMVPPDPQKIRPLVLPPLALAAAPAPATAAAALSTPTGLASVPVAVPGSALGGPR